MRILALGLSLLASGVAGYSAGLGDQVVVIYNSCLPESRGVANYYAEKRAVPSSQVIGFNLSTNEDMSRAEFRDSLQRPLAKWLEDRQLWHIGSQSTPATNDQPARVDWVVRHSKIRYAVLCYGLPLRIESDPTVKEEAAAKQRPEMRRNEAAVDSELALLPLVDEPLPLAGPLRNPVYSFTNSAQLHPTNGVLMVARLDGPSAAIARGLVDKALQAEKDGLWGRAYVDLRGTTEPGYKIGDDWLRNAGEICRRLGFETVFDEKPETFPAGFPLSQIAIYMGWYAENACGPFAQTTVEFMPGAFAYHLHSFSASTVRSTTTGWVGPFLAKGATATMGCVFEPYLPGTPEMAVFIARFVFYGMTFGEAAYACQPVLSWQTTVVGDPLYHPFGQDPDQLQARLEREHSKLLDWSYLRLLNINLAAGKPLTESSAMLENIPVTKQSAVLREKLGDLYAAEGKPSSAVHEWEEALKLEPSPEQAIRLLLTLGEKLTAENPAAAYDRYRQLLAEHPGYPNKAFIYQKLVSLAEKLGKTSDKEKYLRELRAGGK